MGEAALAQIGAANWSLYQALMAGASAGLPVDLVRAGEALAVASNPRRYLVSNLVQRNKEKSP